MRTEQCCEIWVYKDKKDKDDVPYVLFLQVFQDKNEFYKAKAQTTSCIH